MVIYAVASAMLAYLIKTDSRRGAAHARGRLGSSPSRWWRFTSSKAIGAYFSDYLMEDVGQRVVMDLRDQLYGHILGQSAAFFARHTTGQLLSRVSNDVGQVQRAVSETAGDLLQESFALVGYARRAHLHRRTAGAGLHDGCAAGDLSAGPPRPARSAKRRAGARKRWRSMSHIGAETFSAHRIVKAFGAEQREAHRFRAALHAALSHQHARGGGAAVLPPSMELLGGIGMALALWYGSDQIAARPADDRRLHLVHGGAAADVRAGEEVEPRERQPAAERRGGRPHLRDARHRTPRWRNPRRRSRCRRSRPRSNSAT